MLSPSEGKVNGCAGGVLAHHPPFLLLDALTDAHWGPMLARSWLADALEDDAATTIEAPLRPRAPYALRPLRGVLKASPSLLGSSLSEHPKVLLLPPAQLAQSARRHKKPHHRGRVGIRAHASAWPSSRSAQSLSPVLDMGHTNSEDFDHLLNDRRETTKPNAAAANGEQVSANYVRGSRTRNIAVLPTSVCARTGQSSTAESLLVSGHSGVLLAPICLVFLLDSSSNRFTWPSFEGGHETIVMSGRSDERRIGAETTVPQSRDVRRAQHVVTWKGRLFPAEMFESRLNAEVAPLLQQHIHKIWGPSLTPALELTGPTGSRASPDSDVGIHHYQEQEEQRHKVMLAFSLDRSGSLPESTSTHGRERWYVTDGRDVVLSLPSHSSRYTFSVRLRDDSALPAGYMSGHPNIRTGSSFSGSDNNDVGAADDNSTVDIDTNGSNRVKRVRPHGVVAGNLQVQLSEVSRLAVNRYSGVDRRQYAQDVVTESVTELNSVSFPSLS